ncbi:peptidoglycan-binding protein [Streptomyces sp. CA-278952]|uniref:peptidoglycan-binding protein n=1 Tax=unclassified Streptomyces TaxID=2593676 RepID=UPI0022426E8C|nr:MULTISPECIES: peptidoglycan-binding protein [unclassified Streptomyces]UZI29166.1 peptidoglycan-binding protein [Streptomyces sp. VB1]WDG29120.1 peptidoglycan-binding protein [Streptomyces sp. CA-278952]
MVGTAVLLSVAGVLAAQLIKSPAQAVADTAPPPPSVISAPVEKRILKDTVIIRGTVTSEQSIDVTPNASGPDAGAPVVTRLPVKAKEALKPGQLLLEVSGRPVIALQGSLPMYRDLKPGASGDDVAQLQKGLAALGHATTGDTRGYFGAGTKAAVSALYEDLGYTPLAAAADGAPALEEARDHVVTAQRGREDLPPSASRKEIERADADLRRARQRLTEAEAASGPMIPVPELVFLSSFPARVDRVDARVGSQTTTRALTVSAGALVVNGTVQAHQKELIQAGQKVEILSELTGATAPGTVASVSDAISDGRSTSATDEADPSASGERGYPLVVKPTKKLPLDFAGQDVRLTVEAASTEEEVLVVPVSAVSAGADGRTSVTVLMPDGESRRRVQVTTGTSGEGTVQVRPSAGESLAEGDTVVIGVAAGANDHGERTG